MRGKACGGLQKERFGGRRPQVGPEIKNIVKMIKSFTTIMGSNDEKVKEMKQDLKKVMASGNAENQRELLKKYSEMMKNFAETAEFPTE